MLVLPGGDIRCDFTDQTSPGRICEATDWGCDVCNDPRAMCLPDAVLSRAASDGRPEIGDGP
jgi:hypothetical protein